MSRVIVHPIWNEASKEFAAFFDARMPEFDASTGTHCGLIFIGDPAGSGPNYMKLNPEVSIEQESHRYRDLVKAHGEESDYRVAQNIELMSRFDLPADSCPCLVFRFDGNPEAVAYLRIDPVLCQEPAGHLARCLNEFFTSDVFVRFCESESSDPVELATLVVSLGESIHA